jgi:hypothetical protein
MLKRGWYCLMKFCSASSASASVLTVTNWMSSMRSRISTSPRTTLLEKCEATRFLIDFALPT